MHIVGDTNRGLRSLLFMIESIPEDAAKAAKMKFHRNFATKLHAKLVKSDRWYERRLANLELARERINKSRPEPLKFNWDEAAESSYVTDDEPIHISEAGPKPLNVRQALHGKYYKYFLRAMLVEMESLTNLKVISIGIDLSNMIFRFGKKLNYLKIDARSIRNGSSTTKLTHTASLNVLRPG